MYLVDTYQAMTGASAVAANGLLRYTFGAAFPLFTLQMYERLGIDVRTTGSLNLQPPNPNYFFSHVLHLLLIFLYTAVLTLFTPETPSNRNLLTPCCLVGDVSVGVHHYCIDAYPMGPIQVWPLYQRKESIRYFEGIVSRRRGSELMSDAYRQIRDILEV